MTAAHILDLDADAYHRDDVGPTPTLSASLAHILATKSPAHAWAAHPRLGGKEIAPGDDEDEEEKSERDKGTAVHEMLLGRGSGLVRVDAPDFRGKEARQLRDDARASGKVPMVARKYDALQRTVERIRTQLGKRGIVLGRERSEMVIAWTDETAAGPVECRSMLDHVSDDWTMVTDLKTCRDASPDAVQKSIIRWGYAIQRCAYVRAVEALKPEMAGRVKFRLVMVETAPPYALNVVTLDGVLREYGTRQWERAALTWGACLASDTWPDYGTSEATAPAWALAQEEQAST